jgi:gamma-glutamyl-gamma-aminobutyrate hydrolase PuuD
MLKIGVPISSSKTQYFINQAYIQYVADSGFHPVLIVPEVPIGISINTIDGLLLPGGIDVDPIFYGEDNISSFGSDPVKDDFERKLFHAAVSRKKPVFGICRGFQLIIKEFLLSNRKLNEALYFCNHIVDHNQVDNQQLSRNIHQHFVECFPRILYSGQGDAGNRINIPVNSMHHQCLIADIKKKSMLEANGFKMAAWTQRGLKLNKNKDIVEVVCEAFKIETLDGPILAVQWHPEELLDKALIQNFFHTKNEEN